MLAPLPSGQSANSCADTADIEFHCPECQQPLAIDRAAAGTQVPCPRCQKTLLVPANAPATPSNRQDLRNNSLGAEMERLEEIEGCSKREFEQLRAELSEAIRDRDTLARRLEALSTNSDQGSPASAELARVREDLHYARAELADTAEQRAILQVDAKRLESEFKTVVSSLKAELEESLSAARLAREQTALAERKREEMEKKLSGAPHPESEAVGLRELVTRLQGQIATILKEREGLKSNLADVRTQVKTLESDLDTTKQELEAGQEKLREVAGQSAQSAPPGTRSEGAPAPSEAIATSQADNQALRAQLIDSQRCLAVMRLERDRVRAHLQEREETIRKSAAALEVARADLDRQRQEHAELGAGQEQLRTLRTEAIEETKALHQRVDSLLETVQARERELAEARQTLAVSIVARHEARAQIATFLSEQEKLKLEMTEANRRTEATCQRLEVAETAARQWRVEREQMRANAEIARAEREKAIASLSAKEADARATATQLREEAIAGREKYVELERRLQSARVETAALRVDLEAARGERDEVARRAAARDSEMREVTAQSERQKTVEHTFLLHLQAAEANVAAAREKTAQLESEREGVDAELANARAELEGACQELEQVKKEREAARTAVIDLEIELEKSLDQRGVVENERTRLAADLEATRAGLDRAKQHVQALQTRRDQMRDEIARLKVQLGLAPNSRS